MIFRGLFNLNQSPKLEVRHAATLYKLSTVHFLIVKNAYQTKRTLQSQQTLSLPPPLNVDYYE